MKKSCFIVHTIAIVWCRPNCYKLVIEPIEITFLNKLMSSDDETQIIQEIKMIYYFMAEDPSSSSAISSPSFNILRIGPHEIS
jgi:hypothetical protein